MRTSFVNSIFMDHWTPENMEMLRQGGNQKIRDYFRQIMVESADIDESSIVELYQSEAAEHYRQRLRERVRHLLSQSPVSITTVPNTLSEFQANNADLSSTKKYILHSVVFTEQTLGMRLSRRSHNSAVVSRVTSDGYAEIRGITVGDTVWAVNDIIIDDYTEILSRISTSGRPLKISFFREADESRLLKSNPESGCFTDSTTVESSDSEDESTLEGFSPIGEGTEGNSESEFPRVELQTKLNDIISFDYRVTFYEAPLGITVSQDILDRSEVTAVSDEGHARRQGVRVGDLLVGLENKWFTSYQEAMSTLPLQPFPFTLVFRRYSRGK